MNGASLHVIKPEGQRDRLLMVQLKLLPHEAIIYHQPAL